MELFVDGFELRIGDMGVDLSGSDVGVSEKALDTTDVGAVDE